MSSSSSQLLSKYHPLFDSENTCVETETNLDFISSIWDYDHILRLGGNKWQYLWCNKTFQRINATKALAGILGKKGVHIKICYVKLEKSHIKYRKM